MVADVAFSPDGTVIVTGSYDGTARTWEVTTGRPLVTFAGHAGQVEAVSFAPDGSLFGLRRLGPSEVSRRCPEVRRLPPDAPIFPA